MKKSSKDEPSLRLSVEIGLLIEILINKLQKFGSTQGILERINQKILGLVFSMMRKIFENYAEYLFPYLKSAKIATAVEEGISRGGESFK